MDAPPMLAPGRHGGPGAEPGSPSRGAAVRCATIAVGSRLAVLLAGYVAVVTIGYGMRPIPPRASRNEFLNLPARWDAGWYVGIASAGYRWRAERPRYERLKFFPAYPLLLRAAARTLTRVPDAVVWLWTGVVVSTVLFWIALLYVFRLAVDLEGEAVARRAVWITAAYPFGLFFGLPYSESLFLASAVAALYHYRRAEWWPAATCGVIAGLTRPTGILLSVVLALAGARGGDPRAVRRSWQAVAVLSPLVGTGLFSAYLLAETGNALVWAVGQPGGRGPLNPLGFVGRVAAGCWTNGTAACLATSGYDLLNIAATAAAVACVAPVAARYGSSLGAFVLLGTAMPLFGVGFNCMGRYTSVLFPVFLWLAARLDGWSFRTWIAISAVCQGLLAAAFFTWRPVY